MIQCCFFGPELNHLGFYFCTIILNHPFSPDHHHHTLSTEIKLQVNFHVGQMCPSIVCWNERQKYHFYPHKWIFCSYLAVVAGLCAEADYIFIPESPPKSDWPVRLCQQLTQARTQLELWIKQNYHHYHFIQFDFQFESFHRLFISSTSAIHHICSLL